MFTFNSIPDNYDLTLYLRVIAKKNKIPLEIVWSLVKSCNSEKEFFEVIKFYSMI